MHPIGMIDKIEVILGPGSVLYGANAFAGIINIITNTEQNTAGARLGSFDTVAANTNLSYAHFSLFAQYLKIADGFAPEFGRDGKERREKQDQDRDLFLISARFNLTDELTFNLSKTFYEYPFTYSKFERSTRIQREPLTASLQFHHGKEETWKFDATVYYVDYFFEEIDNKVTTEGEIRPRRRDREERNTLYAGTDVFLTKKMKEDHIFLLGGAYQFDNPNGDLIEIKRVF